LNLFPYLVQGLHQEAQEEDQIWNPLDERARKVDERKELKEKEREGEYLNNIL